MDNQFLEISYNTKFSSRIIFAFFADWHQTSKIKLRKILEYRIDAMLTFLARSLIRENCFHKNFENPNLQKLCASKIWLYMVFPHSALLNRIIRAHMFSVSN